MKSSGSGLIWAVLVGVVCALMAGGTAYFLNQSQNNSLSLQEKVKNLQNEVENLKKGQVTEQSAFPTPQSSEPTDNRKLLMPGRNGIYLSIEDVGSPACSGDGAGTISNVQANSQVAFSSKTKGIAMKAPFNSNWFSSKYRIDAYDESESGVNFGNLAASEGCGFHRGYSLGVIPYRIEQPIIADLNNKKKDDVTWTYGPVVETINGLRVVKSKSGGLCETAWVEIVGKKYNYSLTAFCSPDFKPLDSIINTISLL